MSGGNVIQSVFFFRTVPHVGRLCHLKYAAAASCTWARTSAHHAWDFCTALGSMEAQPYANGWHSPDMGRIPAGTLHSIIVGRKITSGEPTAPFSRSSQVLRQGPSARQVSGITHVSLVPKATRWPSSSGSNKRRDSESTIVEAYGKSEIVRSNCRYKEETVTLPECKLAIFYTELTLEL
jgi:hypothetical protein